ncbi:MAG TPA: D-glycerate dehydrogenase [Candidatus Thermoplasmatota archaeon]|nr:D-glycerate dehydrogenase [Candidatus Thermoplasmatota archaeon]
MMKVFVTRKIPESGINLLKNYHTVTVSEKDRVLSKDEIIDQAQDAEGLLCLLTDTIDSEVISSLPNLKMIANYAVGFNNVDVEKATQKKIPVSNTPGVLTDTTAELAWALVFSVARRIVESDSFCRDGKFEGWAPMLMLGQDITKKTLGIIGSGRIGTAMALKSKGFDMNVLYVNPEHNSVLESEINAKKTDLSTLLMKSDIVTLHVPLTDETHHLIGEKELDLMKETAVLINTSRGPVIDENALLNALENKQIFGAGLDVYEHEPKIPKKLKQLDNVVILPHIGSATKETRSKMAEMAAENMLQGLNGKQPSNCVNPEVFE